MEFNWADEVEKEFGPGFPTSETANSNYNRAENEEFINSTLDQNAPSLEKAIRISKDLTSVLQIPIHDENILNPDEITIVQPQNFDDETVVPSQNHDETSAVSSPNADEAAIADITADLNLILQIPLPDVEQSDGQIIERDFPFTGKLSIKSRTMSKNDDQSKKPELELVPTTSYAEYQQGSGKIPKPKKSVTFNEPIATLTEYDVPTSPSIKKFVKFAEPITTSYDCEPERIKNNLESTVELTTLPNETNATTESSVETSSKSDNSTSQAITNSMPLTFGAVEYTKPKTSIEIRTEDVKRLIEELNIEVCIPLFPVVKKRAPMTIINNALRRPLFRDSRPVVYGYPRVLLELTLNQPLIISSLRDSFHIYIKRGLQFKSLGGRIILLLFRNEHDANEVLEHPCCLGTIVPISDACERTQQVVARYRSNYFHYRI